jgi:hypothetical protein
MQYLKLWIVRAFGAKRGETRKISRKQIKSFSMFSVTSNLKLSDINCHNKYNLNFYVNFSFRDVISTVSDQRQNYHFIKEYSGDWTSLFITITNDVNMLQLTPAHNVMFLLWTNISHQKYCIYYLSVRWVFNATFNNNSVILWM